MRPRNFDIFNDVRCNLAKIVKKKVTVKVVFTWTFAGLPVICIDSALRTTIIFFFSSSIAIRFAVEFCSPKMSSMLTPYCVANSSIADGLLGMQRNNTASKERHFYHKICGKAIKVVIQIQLKENQSLLDLLSKYHLVHFPALTNVSISSQLFI